MEFMTVIWIIVGIGEFIIIGNMIAIVLEMILMMIDEL